MAVDAAIAISYFEAREKLTYELMRVDFAEQKYVGTGRIYRKVDSMDEFSNNDLNHVENDKFYRMRRVFTNSIDTDPGPGTSLVAVA